MSSTAAIQARDRDLGRQSLSGLRRREAIMGYLFISPWLLGLLIFTIGPFIVSFYLSFTTYSILQPGKWIGLDNYVTAFTDDRLFWKVLGNTVYYVLGSVPLRIVLGFLLALLLNVKVRGLATWRTLFYVPSITPLVATIVLWRYLLNPKFGLINYALSLFGIKAIPWLTSPTWAKPALLIMSIWWVGGSMVIFLAGLQGIPDFLYEAAELDGANMWRRLRHVTLPMMTPTIFFVLIINLINAFQVFAQSFIMTRGGPLNSTRFFMHYLYDNAFLFFKMGFASAMAWLLFIIIFVLTILMVKTSDRWVFYGA